jgi:hypothetical protein
MPSFNNYGICRLCMHSSFTYIIHANRGMTGLLVMALSSQVGIHSVEAGHLTTPGIDEDEVK